MWFVSLMKMSMWKMPSRGRLVISMPKPMGSSSSGSNCLTMARYSSTQATASMTAYFQPPSVKKICAQPDFAKISADIGKNRTHFRTSLHKGRGMLAHTGVAPGTAAGAGSGLGNAA